METTTQAGGHAGTQATRAGDDVERRLMLRFVVPFLAILVALTVLLIVRESRRNEESELAELEEIARTFYEQIAVTRLWNARHGGVYVRATRETPPNPHLPRAQRDIYTADGTHYTRVNPAYMTRQLSEIARRRLGNQFRIVGDRPLNPANAPSAWEAEALDRIGRTGATAPETDIQEKNGERQFVSLMPLRIEQPCLDCHARQGYRAGDLKGGVVVRIPMGRYDAIRAGHTRMSAVSLGVMGIVSALCAALIGRSLSRRLAGTVRQNLEQQKRLVAMELAGAAAHELRQPMTVVRCLTGTVKEKALRGEAATGEEMDIINEQCLRMDGIIERMLNIVDYRSKEYLPGISILDLERASSPDAAPGGGGRPARPVR